MAEPVSRPVGNAFEQAIALLDERSLLPTCVVFALDHVLWPFTCGSTVESPDDVALYPHASAVLAALKTRGVRASACSVTAKPSAVQSLLQQLNIADYLSPKKLSTRGTTTDCLKSVRQETGIAFGQTLYVDASVASIQEAEALGVTGVRLRGGLSCAALESGLRAFEQRGLDSRGF